MSFESFHSSEQNPLKRFVQSCEQALNKLVSEEVIPAWFAKERVEAAERIETLLTGNAEQDGIDFAHIGIEQILQFHEGLDRKKEDGLAAIDLLITKHTLWAEQAASRPEIQKRMLDTISRLQSAREAFILDVEKTKRFEA